MMSYFYMKRQSESKRLSQMHSSISLQSTASIRTVDELYDGKFFSMDIFCPTLTGKTKRSGGSNIFIYVQDQSWATKLKFCFMIFDIISDILFAHDTYNNNAIKQCVGMISATSAMVATMALILCWYLDFQSWKTQLPK